MSFLPSRYRTDDVILLAWFWPEFAYDFEFFLCELLAGAATFRTFVSMLEV